MHSSRRWRASLWALLAGLMHAALVGALEIEFPFSAEGRFTKTVSGNGWRQTVAYHAVMDGRLTAVGEGQHGEDTVRLALERKVLELSLKGTATDVYLGATTREEFDLSFEYDLASGGYLDFDAVRGEVLEIVFELPDAATAPFGPYRVRMHAPGPYSNCDLYCQPHGVWQFGHLFPVAAEATLPTARASLLFRETDIRIKTDPSAASKNFVVWTDLDTGEMYYASVGDEGEAHLLLGSDGRYNVYGAVWHPTPWGSGADHFVHNFCSEMDAADVTVAEGRPDVESLEIEYPRPLVLVHGWQSDRDCWKDAVPFLRRYSEAGTLGHAGYLCFPCDTLQTRDGSGGVEPNADRLAAYIEDLVIPALRRICAGNEVPQVDLVTHSMGGLISRAYLGRYGGRHVASLTFLATPNGGSYTADVGAFLGFELAPLVAASNPGALIVLRGLQSRFGNVTDLTVRRARRFNNTYAYPAIPCHHFAGAVNSNIVEPDPDDMIVYRESVLARNGPIVNASPILRLSALLESAKSPGGNVLSIKMDETLFGRMSPGTNDGVFSLRHVDMPANAQVLSAACAFLEGAWPGLAATDPGTPQSAMATGVSSQERVVILESGLAGAGKWEVVSAELSGGAAAFVIVGYGGPLAVEVKDPLGRELGTGSQGAGDAAGGWAGPLLALSGGEDFLWAEVREVTSPAPGTWTVSVSAPSEAGTEPRPFLVLASEDGPVSAAMNVLPGIIDAGTPVHVTATVDVGSVQPSSLQVSAEVTLPAGATLPLALFDDGRHGDGLSGDGRYGGEFAGTGQAGEHWLRALVQGRRSDGTPFRRTSLAQFSVRSDAAGFVGEFRDSAEDVDADGNADWLKVGCLITIETAGAYTITGDLTLPDGTVICGGIAAAFQALPGQQWVDLRVPIDAVGANATTQPLELRDLTIWSQDDGLERPCGEAARVVLRSTVLPLLRIERAVGNRCRLTWEPAGRYDIEFDVTPEFRSPLRTPAEGTEFGYDLPVGPSSGFFRLVLRP